MKSAHNNPLLLSLLAGICLWAGWPSSPFFPFLFIGMALFIRSAMILIETKRSNLAYFSILYLGLLTWNSLGTWWLYHATIGGLLMANLANAALMTLPFFFMKFAYKTGMKKLVMPVFVFSWLGFEYLHHNWSLTWPWLTLGNGLAKFPEIVQWYEYTGTAGGSLWILIVSALLYSIFSDMNKLKVLSAIGIFLLPIFVSFLIFKNYELNPSNSSNTVEVVVLQPNFNTFTQKWSAGKDFIPYYEQLKIMIEKSREKLTQKTAFLVWPETSISGSHRESYFKSGEYFGALKTFLKDYPNLSLVAGFDSYELCKDQQNPTEFASFQEGLGYYESYNSALLFSKDSISIYHKSKFVPGAEQVPFPWLITPLEAILGGVGFGHFFGQEYQVPFTNQNGVKVAPSICYESIFGEHIAEFNKNGAQILFILTNDDWWNNTEGHRHHYDYARLRAIENRLPIARSANTGFSGFFNAKGEDFLKTEYRQNACLKSEIVLGNTNITFYANHGDYIGKIASFLLLFLLVFIIIKKLL